MQTFDQAFFALHQAGKISFEEAIKNADSANNLRLRINLSSGAPGAAKSEGAGLSLEALGEPEEEEEQPGALPLLRAPRPDPGIRSYTRTL